MAYILPEAANVAAKVISPTAPVIPNAAFEIPARYRNSFYLANSALFDCVNWYVHSAYEVIFPTLTENIKQIDTKKSKTDCEKILRNVIGMLEQCNSIIDVRFPVMKQNGSIELIRGFRAQHGMASGYQTALGGFRMSDELTRDHIKGLSALATYRNALMGIGVSGAHGGIKISPTNYSKDELQRIMEEYTVALINKGYCNDSDIMQPDMNSTSREMTWISNTLAKFSETSRLAASGKCVDAGGIDNYSEMAPHGVYLALKVVLNNEDLMKKCDLTTGLKDKTFIIQGLGKVGAPLAKLLAHKGAICVGVKDRDAYVYDPKGINLEKLFEYIRKDGTFHNYPLVKFEASDVIYKENADLLIFAAKHKSLYCYVADNVKAKVIVEAADCPVTPSAHKVLTGKSRLVVPDIYACSGATIASYLEYISNLQHLGKLDQRILNQSHNLYEVTLKQSQQAVAVQSGTSTITDSYLSRTAVLDTIEYVLNDTGKEIFKYADILKLGTDIRTAAYTVGITKILKNIIKEKKFIL